MLLNLFRLHTHHILPLPVLDHVEGLQCADDVLLSEGRHFTVWGGGGRGGGGAWERGVGGEREQGSKEFQEAVRQPDQCFCECEWAQIALLYDCRTFKRHI